ncbi:MAG TPA: PIN domain-containing protein [Pyrinomonadaceae bacterium]|nr:PIN domain-containing protein [Pyrinomonadaceae bacterium]
MIHLDTSFLIKALLPNSAASAKLQTWLTDGEDLRISTIAWCEFLCGPLTPNDAALAEVLLSLPEPFLALDARKAAELFNATGRRSRSLADCQIAAVALRCGARLATANASDFALFQEQGLTLA